MSFGAFHRLIVGAVIASMLAVAAAPIWHSHTDDSGGPQQHSCCCESHGKATASKHPHTPAAPDHPQDQDRGGDDHHDCPICLAVYMPVGGNFPPPMVVFIVTYRAACDALPPVGEPGVRFLPVLWPCGPPTSLA